MEKRKRFNIRLNTKFAAASIVLAVLLSVALTSVFYLSYKQSMVDRYTQQITSLVNTAAAAVDSQKVRGYIEGAEAILEAGGTLDDTKAVTDEVYDRMRTQFITIQRENRLEYLYSYHPSPIGLRSLVQGTLDDDPFHFPLGGFSALGDICTQDDIDYAMGLINDPNHEKIYISDTEYGYLITAYAIVNDETGTPYLVVGADMSMNEINSNLNRYILIISLLAMAIVSVFIAIYLILLRRSIIQPLQVLVDSAVSFVSTGHDESGMGSLQSMNVQIFTGDEIEDLATAFNQMTEDIVSYINDITSATSEKERIETELRVATQIQEGMLPRDFVFPGRNDFELFASMRPAKSVGGDFYDFFFTASEKLCLVIGDVSGKGVPAALFMAMAKAQVKDLMLRGLPVQEAMYEANNSLCKNNEQGMFVTLYVALLDLVTGQMDFCDAGHNPAVLWHVDGRVEEVKSKKGLVAGGMEDFNYKSNTIFLEKGDILYTYTDGVSEAQNLADELYGDKRISAFVKVFSKRGVQPLCEGILDDVDIYAGEAPQFDDITMLAIEYKQ